MAKKKRKTAKKKAKKGARKKARTTRRTRTAARTSTPRTRQPGTATPIARQRRPYDPWSTGHVDDTLDSRKAGYQGLMGLMEAIHGKAKGDVAYAMMDGTEDTIPRYERVRRGAPDYERARVSNIKDVITTDYETDGDISPLRKMGLSDRRRSHEVVQLVIQHGFLGAKDAILRELGKADFAGSMKSAQQGHMDDFKKQALEAMLSGYNPTLHATNVYNALQGKYHFDAARVVRATFTRKTPQLVNEHMEGTLTRARIYELAGTQRRTT